MRSLGVFCVLLVASGCMGDPLSAGSNEPAVPDSPAPPATPAPAPTTLATLDAIIDAFAMDQDNLYFTSEDGSLYSLAREGTSTPVVLASAVTAGSNFTGGLAVDGARLFWTALGDGMATGAILAVPKTGGTPVTLAGGQARPLGIAVDDTSVYWANQGAPPPEATDDAMGGQFPAAILSLPKAGGDVAVLATGLQAPDAVALGPGSVVWHETYALRSVAKTGGAPTTLTTSSIAWESSNLVVSGELLYWGENQGTWSIQSVGLAGGSVTTLAPMIDSPGSIFADTTGVYWDVAGGTTVGAIETVVNGVAGITSAPDLVKGSVGEQASFFLADESAFYWVEYWTGAGAGAPTVVIRSLPR
jgi:hypothetical protein